MTTILKWKAIQRGSVLSLRYSWQHRSKSRPQNPGSELFVTHASEFALGLLSASHGNDLIKDPPSDLLDRLAPIQNSPGVDVHVLIHMGEERCVRGDFDAWSRLAAIDTSPSGGKNPDIATARHQSGHAHGIVTRSVHEAKSGRGDRLGVLIDRCQRRLPALGHSTKALFVN